MKAHDIQTSEIEQLAAIKELADGGNESAVEILDLFTNLSENTDADEITQAFGALFALSEDSFKIIAPQVMESYKRSLNNATDKLILTQALAASGVKIEELAENFDQIVDEIDKIDSLPVVKKDFMKELLATIFNVIYDTQGVAKKLVEIPFQLLNENAIRPEYAHDSDSGMDVFATEDYKIKPGETILIPTGIKVALPPGYELQVRPKSGRCLKTKLRVANTPGTIDAGYREEIAVIVENVDPPIRNITYEFDPETHRPIITSIEHGRDFVIEKGQKFAQLVLMEVAKAALFEVNEINPIEGDRNGGFGSTGLTEKVADNVVEL